MIGVLRFLAGLFLGVVFLVGGAAAGYILFEEFGQLAYLIIAAVIILLVLNITAFTSFPRSINIGLATPQIALLMVGAFYFSSEKLELYLSDDFAYRSCVGNRNHEQGIRDCTQLLNKLETRGEITLKEIENTSGDYWIAEMLSYRGRHYIRSRQMAEGKSDFQRALLIPEGVAVSVNNLAEAGFTRSDLFSRDYELIMTSMSENSRCMASASKLGQSDVALGFSEAVSSRTLEAIKLCRVSTGMDEKGCEKTVNDRIRSIISLSNRFYTDSTDEEMKADLAQCNANQ